MGEWEVYKEAFKKVSDAPDTFITVTGIDHYKIRTINALGQLGYFSDMVPYGSIGDDLRGMYRGDGMLVQPSWDPFWDKIGLTPEEVKIDGRPEKPYQQLQEACFIVKPNPFTPSTNLILYSNKGIAGSRLSIYDINGRLVNKWSFNNKENIRNIKWSAPSKASTVYVAVLKTNKHILQKKLILLK